VQRWFALPVDQPQNFSIRYIGLAILSSTAIGVGTAEVLRSKGAKHQRHQALLKQTLDSEAVPLPSAADDFLLGSQPPFPGVSLEQTWQTTLLANEEEPIHQPWLDWDALQAGNIAIAEVKFLAFSCSVLESPQPTHSIQTPAGQQLTAIRVDGEFYCFYHRFLTQKEMQQTAQDLYRSGQLTVATLDEGELVLWVHQPGATLLADSELTFAEPTIAFQEN